MTGPVELPGDLWLTARDAARVIGCAPHKVARLARTGVLRADARGRGRRWMFRYATVTAFVAARQTSREGSQP